MNNFYFAAQKGICKTNIKLKRKRKKSQLRQKEFEELNISVCHNFLDQVMRSADWELKCKRRFIH